MSATVTTSKSRQKGASTSKTQDNLDELLDNVKKVDNTCSFEGCRKATSNFAIECRFCKGRFCTSHALQEVHGCGEAIRREEKRKYLHPDLKESKEGHEKAQTKLNMKLKQLQQERKSKQGFQSTGIIYDPNWPIVLWFWTCNKTTRIVRVGVK